MTHWVRRKLSGSRLKEGENWSRTVCKNNYSNPIFIASVDNYLLFTDNYIFVLKQIHISIFNNCTIRRG